MREIYVTDSTKHINIGKQGENGAVCVLFPTEDWISTFGSGAFYCLVRRPEAGSTESAYFISLDTTSYNGYVAWIVSSTDNYNSGWGAVELQLVVDDTIAKSQTWSTLVEVALGIGADAPDPGGSWLAEFYNSVSELKEGMESATANAAAAVETASAMMASVVETMNVAVNAAATAAEAANTAAEAANTATNAATGISDYANAAANSAAEAANSAQGVSDYANTAVAAAEQANADAVIANTAAASIIGSVETASEAANAASNAANIAVNAAANVSEYANSAANSAANAASSEATAAEAANEAVNAAAHLVIDSELDNTSTNPIENQAIATVFQAIFDVVIGDGYFLTDESGNAILTDDGIYALAV